MSVRCEGDCRVYFTIFETGEKKKTNRDSEYKNIVRNNFIWYIGAIKNKRARWRDDGIKYPSGCIEDKEWYIFDRLNLGISLNLCKRRKIIKHGLLCL